MGRRQPSSRGRQIGIRKTGWVPAVRCVWLSDGAELDGFTLQNGHTADWLTTFNNNAGGGVWCNSRDVVVRNCVLSDNKAIYGGGAQAGKFYHSVLVRNQAKNYSGAYQVELFNCLVTENTAEFDVGGAFAERVESCTVVFNQAAYWCGGGNSLSISNSIVFYNEANEMPNWGYAEDPLPISHTCTTPPAPGEGNISDEPGITSLGNPRLLASSPCRDAGENQAWMWGAKDLDGRDRIWREVVDVGAYEYAGDAGCTGKLSVTVCTNIIATTVGFPVELSGEVAGDAKGLIWDFGNGIQEDDAFATRHAWTAPGHYQAVFTAWNSTASASATVEVEVVAGF